MNGEDQWSPRALGFARELERGKKVIEYPPLSHEDGYPDPVAEYARMLNVDRARFPSSGSVLVPSDPSVYAESTRLNEVVRNERVVQLTAELKALGVLPASSVPVSLVGGTFYEALDAYAEDIRRTAVQPGKAILTLYGELRLERVNRFKGVHGDLPLGALNYDACRDMIAR